MVSNTKECISNAHPVIFVLLHSISHFAFSYLHLLVENMWFNVKMHWVKNSYETKQGTTGLDSCAAAGADQAHWKFN